MGSEDLSKGIYEDAILNSRFTNSKAITDLEGKTNQYGEWRGSEAILKAFMAAKIVDNVNGDKEVAIKDSKSISISPVIMGIKQSKAKSLGLIGNKNVTNEDILRLIKEKKIKYVMNSVTQTNSGATAYLGFLQTLAGNPEVLKEEIAKERYERFRRF